MTRTPTAQGRTLILNFGAASLAATALGCVVTAGHGVSVGLWARNLGAWGVGLALALALRRASAQRLALPVLLLAISGVAATFACPALQGVHRWIGAGSIRLNAAELLLPAAIVAWADLLTRRRGVARFVAWTAAPMFALLLALQPDASQASAWALAVVAVLALGGGPGVLERLLLAALVLTGAVAAALRPDPLAPVPEVEGVLALAAVWSPLAAAAAVAALAACVAIPGACTGGLRTRAAGVGLSVQLAAAAVASAFGAFPVPWVGIGVSPILGAWIGVGVLAARRQA